MRKSLAVALAPAARRKRGLTERDFGDGARPPGAIMEGAQWVQFAKFQPHRLARGGYANWVESRIRQIALGWRNWLFAGALRTVQRAEAGVSSVRSGKLNGHDPYA